MRFRKGQATSIDIEKIVEIGLAVAAAILIIVIIAVLRGKDFGLMQHLKDLFRFG